MPRRFRQKIILHECRRLHPHATSDILYTISFVNESGYRLRAAEHSKEHVGIKENAPAASPTSVTEKSKPNLSENKELRFANWLKLVQDFRRRFRRAAAPGRRTRIAAKRSTGARLPPCCRHRQGITHS